MKTLALDQYRFFKSNGFLNYGRVLSDDQLAELREGLDDVLAGERRKKVYEANLADPSSGLVVQQIVNMWEANDAFHRHLYNPAITSIVAELMSAATVRVWHDQLQVKPAKIGGPTSWHQDFPYWPILQPADLVSAWVAIEDATIENGCMSMVRRSHTWGRYKDGTIGTHPTEYTPTPDDQFLPAGETIEIVPCEVTAGSVVFHHCMTWHGAPPNFSPNRRPAIAVHYMPGWDIFEPGDHGTHVVEEHVTVPRGEVLKGEGFPTVYQFGKHLECPV